MRLALILLLLILQVAEGIDEPLREVPASDILTKIESGLPVEYDHVKVVGDLSLGYVEGLPIRHVDRTEEEIEYFDASEEVKVVTSPIRITDSIIDGIVSFNNTILENITDFEGSTFNSTADFESSQFNSTVYFRRSEFNSTADFESSQFNSTVYFESSQFKDYADFSSSKFKGDADFWYSQFKDYASLDFAQFNSTVYFRRSEFNSTADFGSSQFNSTVYFESSQFKDYAYFDDSQFKGGAGFRDSQFEGDAYFDDSQFKGDADFRDSHFKGIAYFVGSQFKDGAYFNSAQFNSITYFGDSHFNGTAYFNSAQFKDNTDFSSSQFKDYADFSSSKFNNFTRFDDAIFQKETLFSDSKFKNSTSFNRSQFKTDAFFEGTEFNCTLYFIRMKYGTLYIRWHDIKELAYDDSAYLSLMENFKKLGYIEDYDNCYYDYRRGHRDQVWGGKFHTMPPAEEKIRKGIDHILEHSYGYGKQPLFPIYWSTLIVGCFTVIWIWVLSKKQDRILYDYATEDSSLPSKFINKLRRRRYVGIFLNAFSFSVTVFLSGTRLFIEPPEIPEARGLPQSLVRKVFLLERLLGAFFSVLFFLAIGATVVR